MDFLLKLEDNKLKLKPLSTFKEASKLDKEIKKTFKDKKRKRK